MVANHLDAVTRYGAVFARRKTVNQGAASQLSQSDVYARPPGGVEIGYLDWDPAPTCFCYLPQTDYVHGVFVMKVQRQLHVSSSRVPVLSSAVLAGLPVALPPTVRVGEPEEEHYLRACTSGVVRLVPLLAWPCQGSMPGIYREGS
jgi:hypothetical protein